MSQEVDINRVVGRLLQTISDLHLKVAMLEAQLDAVVEYNKGGDQGGGERSVEQHHDNAPTEGRN